MRQFDFSIKQWQLSSEEKERLLRGESEVREARLFALRYQLNPHFLVNSLNGISTTLVLDGNAPAATQMLAQIGIFSAQTWIPVVPRPGERNHLFIALLIRLAD